MQWDALGRVRDEDPAGGFTDLTRGPAANDWAVTVNGRRFTTTFDRSTLTGTSRSPAGRAATTAFDANGRVVETQLPGR